MINAPKTELMRNASWRDDHQAGNRAIPRERGGESSRRVRQMSADIEKSPRTQAQRQRIDMIYDSPRMVAQRRISTLHQQHRIDGRSDRSPIQLQRTLSLDGYHATDTPDSINEGLDYGKQLENRNDATEYSGPGFYYVPLFAGIEQAASFEKDAITKIYTAGLDDNTKYVESRRNSSFTLDPDENGAIELTQNNHPRTLWAGRLSDQGHEKVIRPHAYDKDSLLHALKIVAAIPLAASSPDPRDFLAGAEFDIILEENEDRKSFTAPERGEFDGRAFEAMFEEPEIHQHFLSGQTEGKNSINLRYPGLKMPYDIYHMLVNVAEFDFQSTNSDNSANELTKNGPTTGESILPTPEELTELIEAARRTNPTWYPSEED